MTLAQQIDPERLVFVDETGANTSLSPIYAYSPKGQRAYCSVSRKRGPNTTLLSCMSVEGMGASLVVEGAINREVIEAYVDRVLSPELRPGQVVMDNLTAHKAERVNELIEVRGRELLYLPPYSPDFNPIEEAFAKIKALLRWAAARSCEAVVQTTDAVLDAVTAQDARGFFEHCGYRAAAQYL